MNPQKVSRHALRDAAAQAFLYALPLTEIANVRAALLGRGVPPGRFVQLRNLATPVDRFVTTPNADTIYANAFIDLTHGPATLQVPALGDRYGSLSLMDMFSDNIAVLGSRNTGQDGGSFVLVGPTDAGPVDAIRSPTRWVWALARVVVRGPDDVARALEVLKGFTCSPTPGASVWAGGANRSGAWTDWLRAANALMLENPGPATDRNILQRMAPLGIGQAGFDPERFDDDDARHIVAGFTDGQALSRGMGFGGRRVGRWLYPAANTGNFFQDYLGRARIAVSGLAALPPAEATYLAALPPDGKAFTGNGPWLLSFTADNLPQVDAFWSLTMYEVQDDGALFLTPNAVDRYTIGDRTPDVRYRPDGGLDVWISRSDPGDERRSNWLPAPADRPFAVILRAYLPREAIVAQTYEPPAIELLATAASIQS